MSASEWALEAFERFLPPPRARQAHARLAELLTQLRSRPSGGNEVAADIARVRVLYDDILRERYDRVEPRLSDLDQLQTIAGGYPDRGAFLAAIALEPPQGTQDLGSGGPEQESDALILSTVHSAKGKEWDAVFVIWAVDGWFPMARTLGDDDALEEERRLIYVAMTRARDHLAVTYPLNAYSTRRGADYTIDQLSRFIDPGVRDTMQRVVPKFEDAAPPVAEPSAPLDLRELMKRRFGSS
jgi:DNA helicase-2/ATP-dependent DNA helicase PcrA